MTMQPPEYPAGAYVEWGDYSPDERDGLVRELIEAPNLVRQSIRGLTDSQLDTKYRNWTIRQIVHHLADSHVNCYIRYKWALTESSPLIKTYNETKWAEIVDARTMPVDVSLSILEGIHARWAGMISRLSEEELQLTFFHPEPMKDVSLNEALPAYVWHAKHHTAQILWLREQHGW